MNDYDDLDRALFALPLEAPPPGFRDAILRATIYAPVKEPVPMMRTWEIALLGIVLAVAAWLVLLLIESRPFALQVAHGFTAFGQGLAEPATISWIVAGFVIAVWLSFFSGFAPPRLPIRLGRS